MLLVVWLQPLLAAPVVADLDMLLPSVVLIDDDVRAVWFRYCALVIHGNLLFCPRDLRGGVNFTVLR